LRPGHHNFQISQADRDKEKPRRGDGASYRDDRLQGCGTLEGPAVKLRTRHRALEFTRRQSLARYRLSRSPASRCSRDAPRLTLWSLDGPLSSVVIHMSLPTAAGSGTALLASHIFSLNGLRHQHAIVPSAVAQKLKRGRVPSEASTRRRPAKQPTGSFLREGTPFAVTCRNWCEEHPNHPRTKLSRTAGTGKGPATS
jgi:hypothetical protein